MHHFIGVRDSRAASSVVYIRPNVANLYATTKSMTPIGFSDIISLMQYYIIQVATGREQSFVE